MTGWKEGDIAVAEDGTIWQLAMTAENAEKTDHLNGPQWEPFGINEWFPTEEVTEEHGPLSGPAVVYPKPMLESLFFDDLVEIINPHAAGCQDTVCAGCDDAHHRARIILRLIAGDYWDTPRA